MDLPDQAPVRTASPRVLVTAMALMTLVAGLVSGLAYQAAVEDASTDPTRLLPGATRVYVRITRPSLTLRRVMELDRWRNREALALRAETRGLLTAPETRSDRRVTVVPRAVAHRALQSLDTLQLAWVPAPDGVGPLDALAFLEVADPARAQNLDAAVRPFTTVVDRLLGFDIQALERPRGLPMMGDPRSAIHRADLDPHTVLAFGDRRTLEDLLQARVSGRSQPLASRSGFSSPQPAAPVDGLLAHLDPTEVVGRVTEWVRAPGDPRGPTDSDWLRVAIAGALSGIRVRSTVDGTDERFTVRGVLKDARMAGRLAPLFQAGEHRLLDRLPDDAELAASLSWDPVRLPAIAQLLRTWLGELAPYAEGGIGRAVLESVLLALGARDPALPGTPPASAFGGFAGDMAVALWGLDRAPQQGLEALEWVLALRVVDDRAAVETLKVVLRNLLGDDLAFGTVLEPASEGRPARRLHLARRTQPEDTSSETPPTSAAPDGGELSLAWRLEGDVLTLAPRTASLARMDPAAGPRSTYAKGLAGRRARRALPPGDPLYVFLHPDALNRLGGAWGRYVGGWLGPAFRVAVSVGSRDGDPGLDANLGPWTVLATLLAADTWQLDTLALAGLPDGCREALDSMCAAYPNAEPCEPLHPDRLRLALAACRRLAR